MRCLPLFLLIALAGCFSKGGQAETAYEQARERQDGTVSEMCQYAKAARDAYFVEGQQSNYAEWTAKAAQACKNGARKV